MLLYIEDAAAHKRRRKQNVTFIGPPFKSCAALLLRELRGVLALCAKSTPLSLDEFLRTELPTTTIFSLPVKKTLNTVTTFSSGPARKKENFAARVKVYTQRVAGAFQHTAT